MKNKSFFILSSCVQQEIVLFVRWPTWLVRYFIEDGKYLPRRLPNCEALLPECLHLIMSRRNSVRKRKLQHQALLAEEKARILASKKKAERRTVRKQIAATDRELAGALVSRTCEIVSWRGCCSHLVGD